MKLKKIIEKILVKVDGFSTFLCCSTAGNLTNKLHFCSDRSLEHGGWEQFLDFIGKRDTIKHIVIFWLMLLMGVCSLDIYLLFIVVLMCFRCKFHGKGFNDNFLSRTGTTCINGVFALIIFYSHLTNYIYIDMDTSRNMQAVRDFLGQLMVTSFLFYSGFGVYEQIKKNSVYVHTIPQKRVMKVWVRMAFTVCLFAAMQLMLGNRVGKKEFLMSLTGWDNLGNSNWYIFAVLVLYLLTYAAFTLGGDNHKLSIALVFAGTVFYVLFMEVHKQIWWYDTVMCYPVGMVVSYYKSSIAERLSKNSRYLIALAAAWLAFLIMDQCSTNCWRYNLHSVLFILLVMLVSMKIELRSPLLKWFGNNAFWMYGLQRIPMIILMEVGYAQSNPNKTALVAFVTTVMGVFLCEKLFIRVDRLLFGQRSMQAAQ